MTLDELINKQVEMKLTEEMWITFGFQKYYTFGWKIQFESEFILLFDSEDFPRTVEQLISAVKDFYYQKGKTHGIYSTKKELRTFLEIEKD